MNAIMQISNGKSKTRGERGATLVFLGLAIAALLGMMALAIDLGMLYVGRSEAQRAADAGALAGAQVFSQSGCTSGDCSTDTTTQAAAKAQAITVGDTNYVLQQKVSIASGDVTLNFPKPTEPQVTVTVWRKNIPLIFAKVFGKSVGDVSASATAEAFQPGSVNVQCPVPFALANCAPRTNDTLTYNSTNINPACPATSPNNGYFVCCENTSSPKDAWNQVDTSVLAKPILLHFATSSGSTVSSQWNLLDFGTAPSGSQLASYIQSCSTTTVAGCGTIPVTPGNKVGPVDKGIDALINSLSGGNSKPTDGMNNGQDIITGPGTSGTGVPTYTSGQSANYSVTAGTNNTSFTPGTTNISTSKSIVTAPIYSYVVGTSSVQLQPGQPNQKVQVAAWATLFIADAEKPGNGKTTDPCNSGGSVSNNDSPVCVYVLKIVPSCSGTGPSVNTQDSTVPIRLIQGPTSN